MIVEKRISLIEKRVFFIEKDSFEYKKNKTLSFNYSLINPIWNLTI